MKVVRKKIKFEVIKDVPAYTTSVSGAQYFTIPQGTILLYDNLPDIGMPKDASYYREIKTRRSKDTRTWLEKTLQKIFERLTGKKIKFVTKYDEDSQERNTPGRDSALQLDFDGKEENNQSERSGGESSI